MKTHKAPMTMVHSQHFILPLLITFGAPYILHHNLPVACPMRPRIRIKKWDNIKVIKQKHDYY